MATKCNRDIDKPMLILGMEPEDIAFAIMLLGVCMFVLAMSAGMAIFVCVIFVFVLRKLKAGKPAGYLVHQLYKYGLKTKGLLPPHRAWVFLKKKRLYSCWHEEEMY
ncbi:type IV conjugative transfer system protein TraL [bacterium]|nr:type IV conjugative transfer system protein TraL [bacterium]